MTTGDDKEPMRALTITVEKAAEYPSCGDDGTCPTCGDENSESDYVVAYTPQIPLPHVQMEFGGNPVEWTEIVHCCKCGTEYARDDSNA